MRIQKSTRVSLPLKHSLLPLSQWPMRRYPAKRLPCSRCKGKRHRGAFPPSNVSPTGLHTECRDCATLRQRGQPSFNIFVWLLRTPYYIAAQRLLGIAPPERRTPGFKICRQCGRCIPLSLYYADKSQPGGLTRICRHCTQINNRVRYHGGPRQRWTAPRPSPQGHITRTAPEIIANTFPSFL